jgi:ABC-type polysaccharide/polyol phosphate transport system ATPase subunit
MSATVGVERGRNGQATSGGQGGTPAISIADVSKTFRIPHRQYSTLKERALHPKRSKSYDELRALRGISVEVQQGEFFGIVGRNGSGKSTLLKCLAGIYGTDSGRIRVRGRLAPFIELGVGFNPDLPARDNVIINAIMLGLSRKEAQARFDHIIAFAELEEFIDLKLKNYSSGMYVRLAFATAVQVDADVLLIDEVLAVGDASFQQKCFDELTRLQREGRTLLLVTHDMAAVERFCDRAMLIERGEVVDIADPVTIARQYNQHNFRRTRQEYGVPEAELPPEEPPVRVVEAIFETPTESPALTVMQGGACTIRVEATIHEAVTDPIFTVTLLNEQGHVAFSTNTDVLHMRPGTFAPGETVSIRVPFTNYLAPGRYSLTASVARAGTGADIFDAHMSNSIVVIGVTPGGGFADLPHEFNLERH